MSEPAESRSSPATLADFERAIRAEPVTLERGPAGRGLVAVMLNGTTAARVSLPSATDMTRQPASQASAIGASPGPGSTEIDVALPGKQTIRGRLVVLRSVAIGPHKVENVPCVGLPARPPGAAAAVLGADMISLLGAHVGRDALSVRMILGKGRPTTQ